MANAKKCDRCGKYYGKYTSEKCIDDLYDFLGIEENK